MRVADPRLPVRALRAAAWPLAALLGALVLLWPLPVVFGSAFVATPEGEFTRHVWGLQAALDAGSPLSFHTLLAAWPVGVDVSLIDPLHLVPYVVGATLGGPVAGWNMVILSGVLVSGLAGYLLSEGATPGGRALGLAVGLACPAVLAAAVTGLSEEFGVGWVGVQLALLLRLHKRPSWGLAILAGLAIAATAWSGIYNAIWAAIIDVPVALWMLARTRKHLVSGGVGLGLALPYLSASWHQDAALSGGAGGVGDLGPLDSILGWRASHRDGADLVDLLVPDVVAASESFLPHTAYLGIALVVLAAVGLSRAPRARWGWGVGALVFAALALGPHLRVVGDPIDVFGAPLSGPVAWLQELTPLSRLTRWYRAGAVATLLLVPLAARALPGRWGWLGALVVVLDLRLGAPIAVPLPTTPAPVGAERIDGVVAMLPLEQAQPSPGQTSDHGALVQVFHGQPALNDINARPALNFDQIRWLRPLVFDSGRVPSQADALRSAQVLADHGVDWLLVFPDRTDTPLSLTPYTAVFGPPTLEGEGWAGWRLPGAGR
jgi:hypothetical protein